MYEVNNKTGHRMFWCYNILLTFEISVASLTSKMQISTTVINRRLGITPSKYHKNSEPDY